jgi:integral membrane sensor domain MASE1
MRGRDLLASLRNLFVFLGVAALGALTSTLIASLVIPALRDWSQQGAALSWWAGNITGSVVLAPPLLSWMGRNSENQRRELLRAEFGLLLLACGLTGLLVSADWIEVISLRPATLVLPLSLWAAYRFSPAAATPVTGLLALSLSWLPNPNDQRLLSPNALQSQELLALTVSVALVTALSVLVINNNRMRTSRQLRQLAGSLERTVAERTEQLAAANARLQRLSDTDSLTGIANRRRFDGLLSERWRMAAGSGRCNRAPAALTWTAKR